MLLAFQSEYVPSDIYSRRRRGRCRREGGCRRRFFGETTPGPMLVLLRSFVQGRTEGLRIVADPLEGCRMQQAQEKTCSMVQEEIF